jgi:S-adenosylmethionine decarboxylase
MMTGVEWLIDAAGCQTAKLADVPAMRAVCEEVIADMQLSVIGAPAWHQFPAPGGVTGLYLLSESHLTCHTFPELGAATFNLYCCRPRESWPWERRLAELLGATRVVITRCERLGLGLSESRELGAAGPHRVGRPDRKGSWTTAPGPAANREGPRG